MPELDFSKIFGETATSKASFTDENYLNGWGYLGSTPPPYQLFDYLQGLNDKKAKYLYDGINESKNNLLTHNTDSSAHADIRQKFNNYLPLTGTATNADKLDGYHETSFLCYRGSTSVNQEDTLWGQIGIKSYDNCLPQGISDTYNWGSVISLPSLGTRLDIWYTHQSSSGDGLWYRSGWQGDKKPWVVLLDTANYNKYAPTKTGTGASGTWAINITGTATKDGNGNVIADTYLKKAGDTVTGTLNVPTQTTTDNSTKVANTAFVKSAIAPIIPLLGLGGIVAQKLGENGYVKFANGLTIQWGSTSTVAKDVQITFPIQFSTKCFCGLVTAQKSTGYLSGSECNPAVRIASTTGMVATMYDASNTGWYWLAIGI